MDILSVAFGVCLALGGLGWLYQRSLDRQRADAYRRGERAAREAAVHCVVYRVAEQVLVREVGRN